jgi:hypothetical protein
MVRREPLHLVEVGVHWPPELLEMYREVAA